MSSRTIRLLGDTQKRVEEDPVRLLRALRFKAKLGFDFEKLKSLSPEEQFLSITDSLAEMTDANERNEERKFVLPKKRLTPWLTISEQTPARLKNTII